MKLIVALIDFSDVTSELVTLTGRIAHAMESRLILLHVAMPAAHFVGGHERADDSRTGIAKDLRRQHRKLEILQLELKKLGVNTTALMVRSDSSRGNPVAKIVQEIGRLGPDLVVLGSQWRRKWHRLLLGNVTDRIARKVCCPVLLVPTPLPQLKNRPNRNAQVP